MNESNLENVPVPDQRTGEINLPTDKVTIIKVDDLVPNSILIITIDVESPVEKMAIAPVFSKLLAPYAKDLRAKNVTVMLMTTHENINAISEVEMNKAGWIKESKSLIISPYAK